MENYELRPLIASDMGAICKIISAIGIREFKGCFNINDFKGNKKNLEEIGYGVMFDIAGIIISNIPKAEKEIQTFVASVVGMKQTDVAKMPFADYGELIMEIVTKEDFRDFFGRVAKLFNR